MVRSFITFAVDKNLLNHIFLIFLVVLAVFSYQKIPKEIFPPSALDAISITGGYSGTSPDTLDRIAVNPIEDELTSLNGVDRVESAIRSGFFSIVVHLKSNTNRGELFDEIKDIISSNQKDLPSDMDEPVAKLLHQEYPLASIAIASQNNDKQLMLEVAEKLKSKLSKIEDLSDITIHGDVDRELHFKVDSRKLTAFGLNTDEFMRSISSLSEVFPVGIIEEKGDHLFISTQGGESDTEELSNTILHVGNKKVRLGEIATAQLGFSDEQTLSRFNGRPNISISINKSKEGSAITLVEEIRVMIEDFEKVHSSFIFEIYSDSSVWIRGRLNTVVSSIIFGLILVGLSVWIFISGGIALVVSIGIPVSFMIGLISANIMGYSLNMLSLLGALIALGMLVDEAIVVAENIYRHLENGATPRDAAIDGATEMFPAVLTATATTIFAFLPLLIMSGEMGIFMKILPIMISILLLSSLLEAFYFLPLHAKDFLRVKSKKKRNESFWAHLNSTYSKVLNFLLKYKKSFLALFLALTTSLIVVLVKESRFQLFLDYDATQIYINGKVNINSTLEDTQEIVNEIEEILLAKLDRDEVASIASITGMLLDAEYIPHMAHSNFHIFIDLHNRLPENAFNKYINPYLSPEYDDSRMSRDRSADDILVDVQKYLLEISKSEKFENFNSFTPDTGIVANDVEVAFSGDIALVKKALSELTKKLISTKGVFSVENDFKVGKRELELKVNSYGQLLGFTEGSISSLLRPLFLNAEIAKMFYNGNLIKIRSQEKMKDAFETLHSFYVTIPNQKIRVRLDEVVDFKFKDGYSDIFKDDGDRISSVFASLDKTQTTSSELLLIINPLLEKFEKQGLTVMVKGEQKENKKIQDEMMLAAIIAIFLIFIALVWKFGSILLSITLLTSIPLSLLGVLGGHMIMDINLTLPGLLGIVGLSGVVVNDGIIMMDFIKKARSIEEISRFATMRLRPILLTSITTILGLSTLIFFASGQAVILQPMAVSLGFGLAFATILNLFYLPVLYTIIKGRKLKNDT